MSVFRQIAPPLHREGRIYVAGGLAATGIGFLILPSIGWICIIGTIWCYYFFRDPPRVTPIGEALVVAPADGIVSHITQAVPPPELGLPATPLTRIAIFMDVFNCHVTRSPVDATIQATAYRPGAFFNASLDKASEDNERMAYHLRDPSGRSLVLVQIAGLVARRIVCDAREGQTVKAGERVGIIRFGSRVDVYLPPDVRPLVAIGQTMVGGETVLAEMNAAAPSRDFAVR